jgi:plastocyanin
MGAFTGRRRAAIGAATALVLTAGLVAPEAIGAGQALRLNAVESGGKLSFSKSRLTARAGRVTIVMRNPRSNRFPHAIEVEGRGVERAGRVVRAGGTSRVTVRVRRGTYEFYCPVDGHRQAGMEGRLTVR